VRRAVRRGCALGIAVALLRCVRIESPSPHSARPAQSAPPRGAVRGGSSEHGERNACNERNGRSEVRDVPWDCDRALARAMVEGSSAHFELFYGACFPRVYRFALRRLADSGEAEDVAQEVFAVALRRLPSYAGTAGLLSWLFGIARREVSRSQRRLRRRSEAAARGAALPPGEPDDIQGALDARRDLARCQRLVAQRFTPSQRRIWNLRHLRMQSPRDIAAAVGKSEEAVRASLHRMRRSLAAATRPR